MSIIIYHNPASGTSRNTLAMIRQSGAEPKVIEYLKTSSLRPSYLPGSTCLRQPTWPKSSSEPAGAPRRAAQRQNKTSRRLPGSSIQHDQFREKDNTQCQSVK